MVPTEQPPQEITPEPTETPIVAPTDTPVEEPKIEEPVIEEKVFDKVVDEGTMDDVPKTGDESNLGIVFSLLGAALFAMLISVIPYIKEK